MIARTLLSKYIIRFSVCQSFGPFGLVSPLALMKIFNLLQVCLQSKISADSIITKLKVKAPKVKFSFSKTKTFFTNQFSLLLFLAKIIKKSTTYEKFRLLYHVTASDQLEATKKRRSDSERLLLSSQLFSANLNFTDIKKSSTENAISPLYRIARCNIWLD